MFNKKFYNLEILGLEENLFFFTKNWFIFSFCFGRGTSVARRDHGGGLALLESSRGYCRSWYDAEITRNRQWRQRITEDLPDASKMYDWNGV